MEIVLKIVSLLMSQRNKEGGLTLDSEATEYLLTFLRTTAEKMGKLEILMKSKQEPLHHMGVWLDDTEELRRAEGE